MLGLLTIVWFVFCVWGLSDILGMTPESGKMAAGIFLVGTAILWIVFPKKIDPLPRVSQIVAQLFMWSLIIITIYAAVTLDK